MESWLGLVIVSGGDWYHVKVTSAPALNHGIQAEGIGSRIVSFSSRSASDMWGETIERGVTACP